MNHNKEYHLKAIEQIQSMIPLEGAAVLEIGSDANCSILHSLQSKGAAKAIGVNPAFPEYKKQLIQRYCVSPKHLPDRHTSFLKHIQILFFSRSALNS